MKFFALALAVLPALVLAQSATDSAAASIPTSLAGVDPCVLNCSEVAAVEAGCGSVTNSSCVCVANGAFQAAALTCLTTNCNATEIAEAEGLQTELCGGAAAANSTAVSAASAASASGSALGSSITAAAGSASASASATKSSAAGRRVDLINGMGGLAGLVVVLFGLAIGTTLVV